MKQDAERTLLARGAALREASDSTATSQTLCEWFHCVQLIFSGLLCIYSVLGYSKEALPCRVSVCLPHSRLELSEYMLPSESVEVCAGYKFIDCKPE